MNLTPHVAGPEALDKEDEIADDAREDKPR